MAGSPTGTVNFFSPQALLAPDLAVQQQQIERQRALAQALQQMALEPIDAGKGSISPWQGVAKLAQALSAGMANRRLDKQQTAISQAYAGRMGPLFGGGSQGQPGGQISLAGGQGGVSTMGADGSTAPAAPQAPPQPPITLSPSTQAQLTPEAQAGLQAVNADTPPQAPQQPPPPPQAPQRGPLSLTGDPDRDRAMFAMDPGEYMKGVVGANTPADFTKLLTQAGIDPNSPLGHQIMQANVAKQNYVAPVNGRPGSTIRDPFDPSKVIGYDAPNIDGAFPTYGPNGMPTGYQQAPGATQAKAAMAGATTAAQNANEPIAGYDAQGNPIFGSKLDAAHGGNPNFRPAPPLGATAAADVTGKNSAQEFQAISDRASDVPNRIMALRQMQTLVNDPKTVLGPGSHSTAQVSGVLGTISQSMGIPFNPQVATNAAEFNKWASQYSARTAQELGLSGSDSRLALAVHASPNGQMTPQALKQMLPQFIGMENAKQGMGNAAVAWQQSHGAGTVQQFRSAWNANFDPRIYQWMAQGPQQFASNVKGLSPQEAAAVRHKYLTLKQMGALPQ